ncbi:MAG: esterase/lipase family protein [Sphingomonadaceae bacterium]
MAARRTLSQNGFVLRSREEIMRRVELGRETVDEVHPRPHRSTMLGELEWVAEPVRRPFRRIKIRPAKQPRLIMLLPGFATHPVRMRYLARNLERAGHTVKRWGAGFNFGPTPEKLALIEARLLELHQRHGQKVVLVGWSLVGLFARELAWLHPDAVDRVITMGSPFSGSMRANNVWRIYQVIAGHSVDRPPVKVHTEGKPPVETIALWSRRDGIISVASAAGKPDERDRAIEMKCTHLGFTYAPEVMVTLLNLIDEDAGESSCLA